ncbi:MAG: thioredoxin family protein, partial [Pseudomonadales bacterium]|nr:thioredoxin family protein [Pseudomonadales bacterium]
MRNILIPVYMCLMLIGLCSVQVVLANPPLPYDEAADAQAEIDAGFLRAQAEEKLLLITFGANWCSDCRAFDKVISEPELASVISKRYVLVKVDVGNWDKNTEIVERFGNPIAGGIPAVVLLDALAHPLFVTKEGQLASARSMDRAQFALFFEELARLKYVDPQLSQSELSQSE